MSKVSAPARGDWGVLHSGIGILELDDLFPYPPEETEGSYQDKVEVSEDFLAFPSPLKETGRSYKLAHYVYETKTYLFPPPPEVNGSYYAASPDPSFLITGVSSVGSPCSNGYNHGCFRPLPR